MRDVAAEKGLPYEPDREDNVHRLNMAVFPEGATVIPNPYNKIAGFSIGDVHFVPGFPVMAWPMIEWVLDTRHRDQHRAPVVRERSVVVKGAMEALLTPLMQAVEAEFAGVKVFSLPSVDSAEHGPHIELGVKGDPAVLGPAFERLLAGLGERGAVLGPTLVR
jgi:molybdopterin-biosynthesis enzyme MoeA-like protein